MIVGVLIKKIGNMENNGVFEWLLFSPMYSIPPPALFPFLRSTGFSPQFVSVYFSPDGLLPPAAALSSIILEYTARA